MIEEENVILSEEQMALDSIKNHKLGKQYETEKISHLRRIEPENPHTAKARKSVLQLKIDNSDTESLTSQDKNFMVEDEVNRFLGDPAVYPTLDSLFQDINFKSFLEIDPTTAYTKNHIEIKAFTALKRSDKELFIFDDLTLEHKSTKLPLFFKTFHKKMSA